MVEVTRPEELSILPGGSIVERSTGIRYKHWVKMYFEQWVPVNGGRPNLSSFGMLQTGPATIVEVPGP